MLIQFKRRSYSIATILKHLDYEGLTLFGHDITKLDLRYLYSLIKDEEEKIYPLEKFLFRYGECKGCQDRRLLDTDLCANCHLKSPLKPNEYTFSKSMRFYKSSAFCSEPSCEKYGSFRRPDNNKRWCLKHRPEGAVNISNAQCIQCSSKAERVEDIRSSVGPRTKRLKAIYGYVFGKRSHCSMHKLPGHSRQIKPKCECGMLAFFYERGLPYPVRCVYHRLPTDLFFERSICSSCRSLQFLESDSRKCLCCISQSI